MEQLLADLRANKCPSRNFNFNFSPDDFVFFNFNKPEDINTEKYYPVKLTNGTKLDWTKFVSIKPKGSINGKNIENALLKVLFTVKPTTDLIVYFDDYCFNFNNLVDSKQYKILIDCILTKNNSKTSYSWIEPLQNLLLTKKFNPVKVEKNTKKELPGYGVNIHKTKVNFGGRLKGNSYINSIDTALNDIAGISLQELEKEIKEEMLKTEENEW